MSKPVNFFQSARRHFYSADLLLHHHYLANAGQLYGFAAECGIKFLLISHGCPSDLETGDLKKTKKHTVPDFRKHIDQLLENIHMLDTFLDGRNAAHYRIMLPSLHTFSNWKTEHRYYANDALPAAVYDWRQGAEEIMRMLDLMLLDGVGV